jgi:PhzF family phenazine biosynthesis protein
MKVEVRVVNAFVDDEDGGNPAGVVLDADALARQQKQALARGMGVSETAFVSTSEVATAKLEFFTPNRQIPHCGHATIATFSLLRALGRITDGPHSKETIDGNRDILIEGELVFMGQREPRYSDVRPGSDLHARVLDSLRLEPGILAEGLIPSVVNTGNSFLLIPLRDEAALQALKPDLPAVERISEELDLIGYYPFCRATRRPGRAAAARMFGPRYEIPEEAATGMAAGPLACYLHERLGLQESTLLIEQGWLMSRPSPSLITVRLERREGRITSLMAGGRARVGSTRTLEI